MPTIDLSPIFDAVRLSAALCHTVQQHYLVGSQKAGREPVTIADYGSQAIICCAISRVFPDDAVLAEEHGSQFIEVVPEAQRMQIVRLLCDVLGEDVSEADVVNWLDYGQGRESARTWVIDPIDGTQGFLARRHYAIAVGLLEYGQPVAAVIGSPAYADGLLFYALDGTAYVQPLEGGRARQIYVSDNTNPLDLRVVESLDVSHKDGDLTERVRQASGMGMAEVITLDSMDKYAMVAAGDADLYLRFPSDKGYLHKAWDHAAGTALVQAAGGMVTDLNGEPLDFTQGALLVNNRGMVVSNGRIHERVLRGIGEVLEG
jgi:3'(2'), 5'-bisphosphate nucleotidase